MSNKVGAVPPELTAALDALTAAVQANAQVVFDLRALIKTTMTTAEVAQVVDTLTALGNNLKATNIDPDNPPPPPVLLAKKK